MALNSNAKIKDIITSLQNMQGINQKYELQSALNNKGIDATEDDSMAEMILKLNGTPMKRVASGSGIANGDTVTGLNFRPSIVIVWTVADESISTNAGGFVVIVDTLKFLSIRNYGVSMGVQDIVASHTSGEIIAAGGSASRNGKKDYTSKVTDDGFYLNNLPNNSGQSMWIAFE